MAGRRIVVGVDGSSASQSALRWALGEAALRDASVEAVHVWHHGYLGELAPLASPELLGAAEESASATLRRVVAEADVPEGVEVTPTLAQGEAAAVLLERASGAALLVVGSRGRGGFTGLLLGSVSQHCIHHAPCPVVVVPGASS